jgi:hypothetical protein
LREACRINGFAPEQVVLHRGIAAATAGTALFPRQDASGEAWGLEPVFDATTDERARPSSQDASLSCRDPTADVIGTLEARPPALDIQGGEADLVESARSADQR